MNKKREKFYKFLMAMPLDDRTEWAESLESSEPYCYQIAQGWANPSFQFAVKLSEKSELDIQEFLPKKKESSAA